MSHPNSTRSVHNHIASLVASHAAIYSASIDERATDTCCLDCHDIRQEWHINDCLKGVIRKSRNIFDGGCDE